MLKVELTGSEAYGVRDPLVSSCQAVAIITLIYNTLHLHLLDSILTLTFISYLLYQSNSLYLVS